MFRYEVWLFIAAGACLIAALLHIGIILGGPDWYRFFGAGEGMAQLAERGDIKATLITLGIVGVLSLFALYAMSGAGFVSPLPLLKLGLIVISGVFLMRGVAGMILPFVPQHPAIPQNSVTFWIVSSVICLLIASSFIIGLLKGWKEL